MSDLSADAKTIFYQFLEQQPADRNAFLDRACGDNTRLRREVEALFQYHDNADSFLEKPVIERVPVPKKLTDGVGLPLTVTAHGDTERRQDTGGGNTAGPGRPEFTGYEVLGELGRGGMGVVYLARQAGTNRLVALKVILAQSHANEEQRQRFRAEAEAIARLQHPGIVQIFEVGEHEGAPYFSLEYCSAGNLHDYMAGIPIPPREAAELTVSLARSVHAAHAARVIHRDIKPANVLLAPRPGTTPSALGYGNDGAPRPSLKSFVVKLTDFGLSKNLDKATQTRPGLIMGTPSYMAPEQARTDARIGFEADVYALGAILYECLTGRPPFVASTPVETMVQLTREEPVSPRRLQPGVPRDLETICLKCLHKEPGRRYESAEQLAEDLQRFLDDRPILARPVGTLERAWRWARRNLLVTSLLAITFLVLVIGIVATTWSLVLARNHLTEANNQKAIAFEEKDHARQAEAKANRNAAREKTQRERAERAFGYRTMQLARDTWYDNYARSARDLLAQCKPEWRNWEYHYLHHLFHTLGRKTLTGHTRPVRGVHFSPDGRYLVSSDAREVIVWDAAKGTMTHRFRDHPRGVKYVYFGPDSNRLATVAGDDTVRIWDLKTGAEVRFGPEGGKPVIPLIGYNRDEKQLFRTTIPAQPDGTETNPFLTQPVTPDGMRFSPDRKLLVTSYDDGSARQVKPLDGQIKLWDGTTFQELRTLQTRLEIPRDLTFCGSSRRVAWLEPRTGTIQIYDTQTGKPVTAIKDPAEHIAGMTFSPDGQRVAAFTIKGVVTPPGWRSDYRSTYTVDAVKVWDVKSRGIIAVYRGHTGKVTCLDFSPDGRFLASGSEDNTVIIWDTETGRESVFLKKRGVETMCFSPDGRRILTTGAGANQVQVFDAESGKPVRTIEAEGKVGCVSYSPDGKYIATGESNATVHVRVAATGVEEFSLALGVRKDVYHVAFSPSSKYLAATTYLPPKLQVWDVQSRQTILETTEFKNAPLGLSFSADEKRLAVVDQSGALKVWDLGLGKLKFSKEQSGIVLSVSFSPNGQQIATGDDDHQVKLWDAETGEVVFTFKGHNEAVTGVSFSPDGSRLASCGRDGVVKLWDPVNHEEAFSLEAIVSARVAPLTGVRFSPDGRRLAGTAGMTGVIVWDAGDGWKPADP